MLKLISISTTMIRQAGRQIEQGKGLGRAGRGHGAQWDLGDGKHDQPLTATVTATAAVTG
jgi:hypothetical protein